MTAENCKDFKLWDKSYKGVGCRYCKHLKAFGNEGSMKCSLKVVL